MVRNASGLLWGVVVAAMMLTIAWALMDYHITKLDKADRVGFDRGYCKAVNDIAKTHSVPDKQSKRCGV